MKQIRLEALTLALKHNLDPEQTLKIADKYDTYISEGMKAIPVSKPSGVLHISNKKMKEKSS